jgi:hypothetical protein
MCLMRSQSRTTSAAKLVRSGARKVPYVSPHYGGVDARVLNIFQAPGPKTDRQHDGSGFLCVENDDPSAERFATLLDGAGIPVGETRRVSAAPAWDLPH